MSFIATLDYHDLGAILAMACGFVGFVSLLSLQRCRAKRRRDIARWSLKNNDETWS